MPRSLPSGSTAPREESRLSREPTTDTVTAQARRRNPRIGDTDWLVLRDLRAAIATLASRVARRDHTAVDFGCGSQRYESIFTAAWVRYLGRTPRGGSQ